MQILSSSSSSSSGNRKPHQQAAACRTSTMWLQLWMGMCTRSGRSASITTGTSRCGSGILTAPWAPSLAFCTGEGSNKAWQGCSTCTRACTHARTSTHVHAHWRGKARSYRICPMGSSAYLLHERRIKSRLISGVGGGSICNVFQDHVDEFQRVQSSTCTRLLHR